MINIFQIQGLNAWPVPRTVKFLFYMAKIAQIFTSSAGARKPPSSDLPGAIDAGLLCGWGHC